MNIDNKTRPEDEFNHNFIPFDLDQVSARKRQSLIERLKNKFARYIQRIYYQIGMDMNFWIKYRPSRWLSFISKKLEKRILQFIDKKKSKRLIFYTTLVFCLIFIGLFELWFREDLIW